MPLRKLILAALLITAAPAAAQQPSIDALRDSIAASDPAQLRRSEFEIKSAAQESVELMLRRGLILMRLHHLHGDEADISEARKLLERASKAAPGDARTHYAYGLSNAVGHGVRIPVPGLNKIVIGQSIAELVGADPASKAMASFKRALAIDPSLAGAAISLARVSLDQRDTDNMKDAREALRTLVERRQGGAEVATVLSEIEGALGNVTAAADAANAATAMEATSSSALRAQAAALLRQAGQYEAGARAYFAGVDALTPAAAQGYFDDIVSIASEREREEWKTGDLQFRKAFLARFWNARAASAGVTVAERMAEHYQRLALAHDRYRRTSKRGAAPVASAVQKKYANDMLPFDDRGLILTRHGEPDEIVRTSDVDLRANETWVYYDEPQNRLFNFVVLRDASDYRLVEDLLAALDPSTQGGFPASAAAKLLRDRQKYEPRYAAMAERYEASERLSTRATGVSAMSSLQGAEDTRVRLSAEMREQVMTALETDSHEPDFTGDLPFYYDLYSFKGEGDMTAVTVAAAIPGTSVSGRQLGNSFIYSLQASLILIDTVTNNVVRKDTTYSLRAERMLGPNEHLRLHIDLSAPYSSSLIHRVVLRDLITPGKGQIYGGESEIRNLQSDEALMLSSIVLAEPDNGTWTRGEAKLGLVPPRQFLEGRPLRLFYEIYNLPDQVNYRTEIIMESVEAPIGFARLKRIFGGGSGNVRLQFDGVAAPNADGVIQELKQVTAEVKPGKYRVTVRVTNLQDQQSVRSETMFVVLND